MKLKISKHKLPVGVGKKAFDEVLASNPAIERLFKSNKIDLVILTGSAVQGSYDSISDLDIFIILPLAVQKSARLHAEYSYPFVHKRKEYTIEVSFVTTEKLLIDTTSKSAIYWWNSAICLYARNQTFKKALKSAGSYTQSEILDRLWSLSFQFNLSLIQLERFSYRDRNDNLNHSILFFDALRILMEYELLRKGIVKHYKWYTHMFRSINYKEYSSLNALTKKSKLRYPQMLRTLKKYKAHIDKDLFSLGFSRKEIKEWSIHGLTRLTFQKF